MIEAGRKGSNYHDGVKESAILELRATGRKKE